MIRLPFLIAALGAAAPAAGQTVPADGRVTSLRVTPGHRSQLAVTAGSPLTVLFARGERIVSTSVSDASLVEVSITSGQDGVIIRALRPLQSASISVLSDQRGYEFDLVDAASAAPEYLVQVVAPSAASPAGGQVSGYRIRGDKALRPASIRDDGTHTYISWAPDQLIPAVFAVNAVGSEEMVDGYMRGDTFTIDRIHPKLVFRIDRRSASVTREQAGNAR